MNPLYPLAVFAGFLLFVVVSAIVKQGQAKRRKKRVDERFAAHVHNEVEKTREVEKAYRESAESFSPRSRLRRV